MSAKTTAQNHLYRVLYFKSTEIILTTIFLLQILSKSIKQS
jgi:hypothetical protein